MLPNVDLPAGWQQTSEQCLLRREAAEKPAAAALLGNSGAWCWGPLATVDNPGDEGAAGPGIRRPRLSRGGSSDRNRRTLRRWASVYP